MKFGVVVFPGSNCVEDVVYVLKNCLAQEVVILWHKNHDLQQVDFVILPGGFSFGDYLRSGAIARFSPIMKEIVDFAGKGGYVLGICNGFQILTETGLLPGALLHNASRRFICKNIFVKTETTNSLITSAISHGHMFKIPIAHAEGRYFADPKTLASMQCHDQVLFRYCNEFGNVTSEANPNGSIESIAGICNIGRNVFGMMPHPERAASSLLGNEQALGIFQSVLQYW